jgi:hypothetical protein
MLADGRWAQPAPSSRHGAAGFCLIRCSVPENRDNRRCLPAAAMAHPRMSLILSPSPHLRQRSLAAFCASSPCYPSSTTGVPLPGAAERGDQEVDVRGGGPVVGDARSAVPASMATVLIHTSPEGLKAAASAPGGVAPPRHSFDYAASARLARSPDCSPTYAAILWDGTPASRWGHKASPSSTAGRDGAHDRATAIRRDSRHRGSRKGPPGLC